MLSAGVLVALWFEDWALGLTMAAFAVMYIAVHTRGQGIAVQPWREERRVSAELYGFLGERLDGLQDIRTLGAGNYVINRLVNVLRGNFRARFRANIFTELGWTVSNSFFVLGYAAIIVIAAASYDKNGTTLGAVYLAIHYFELLRPPLVTISTEMEDFQQSRAAIERVREVFEAKTNVPESGGKVIPSGDLSVEYRSVWFGYEPNNWVLRDISFHLRPGRTLGILGRTGTGKTTLSRLIVRLYDVNMGSVLVGGVDTRDCQLSQLRHRVGMVTQEVQLFQASVRDNVSLFSKEVSDEDILESLHSLGLGDWVKSLPRGLETEVTAADKPLSAGEAQLLAFARALVRDPDVVILDEAVSRLDPVTERLIERAVRRLLHRRTAIIIAHRLSTIQLADEVMILEDGRVQEHGERRALARDGTSRLSELLRIGLTKDSGMM